MEKITSEFKFTLKENYCVTTIEECGEEMTPAMRVLKKCTSFVDDFCHNPEDEYEIKYALHFKEPNGKSEHFAVNFSYENEEGDTYASYSYIVEYNSDTRGIRLNFTVRCKDNGSDVIKELGVILAEISE
jgi:hypothetical protein